MNKSKRIICLFLATVILLSLILSITATAFAAEVATKDTCAITVSIIDQSGGYPGDSVKVIFKTSEKEEIWELTKENTWGTSQAITRALPAPAQYSISIEGLVKGYRIVDTSTKTSIANSFKAKSEGEKFFGWAIVTEEQLKVQTQGNSTQDANKNSEEQKIYEDFLNAVSFIENDETWNKGFDATLNQYGKDSFNYSLYSQWYTDYVWGGSEEAYSKLSAFEKFLWTETYTRLANAINSGWGYEYFFANEDVFADNITDLVIGTFKGTDAETVKEAYLKIMAWQYDYIVKYGEPFNFIRGRSYTEEMKVPYTETAVPDENMNEEKKVEEPEKEKGIWDETMDSLARNAVSIIVLIVLGCAIFVLYRIRKEKNYDAEKH